MERLTQTLCVLMVPFLFASLSEAGEFRAAAARVEITPEGSEPLWGY